MDVEDVGKVLDGGDLSLTPHEFDEPEWPVAGGQQLSRSSKVPDLNSKAKNSHPLWCFEEEEQPEEVRDLAELVLGVLDPIEESETRQLGGPSEQELVAVVESEIGHGEVPTKRSVCKAPKVNETRNWSKVTFRREKLGNPGVLELESEDPEQETSKTGEARENRLPAQVEARHENLAERERHHRGDEVLEDRVRKTGRVHRTLSTTRKGQILKLARVRPVALPDSEAIFGRGRGLSPHTKNGSEEPASNLKAKSTSLKTQ